MRSKIIENYEAGNGVDMIDNNENNRSNKMDSNELMARIMELGGNDDICALVKGYIEGLGKGRKDFREKRSGQVWTMIENAGGKGIETSDILTALDMSKGMLASMLVELKRYNVNFIRIGSKLYDGSKVRFED